MEAAAASVSLDDDFQSRRREYTVKAFGAVENAARAFSDDWCAFCSARWLELDADAHRRLLVSGLERMGATLDTEFTASIEAERSKRRRAERQLAKHQADRAILMEALEAQEVRSADAGAGSLARIFALEAEIRQLRALGASLASERDEALLRADRSLSLQRDTEEAEARLSRHSAKPEASRPRPIADGLVSRDAVVSSLRGRVLALEVELRHLRGTPSPAFDQKSVVHELLSDIEGRDAELRQLRKDLTARPAASPAPATNPAPSGPGGAGGPGGPTRGTLASQRRTAHDRAFSATEVLGICLALGAALILSFLRVFVSSGCIHSSVK